MKIRIFRTEEALATALARRVLQHLHAQPRLVLGLPTGRTPMPLYRALAAHHAKGETDYAQATTFNLDEFVGIEPSHPGSYRSYMRDHLFRHVNLLPRRTHFLDGRAADLDVECERFEESILRAGGIDLQILGMGTNAHIAFNEPGSPHEARTRLITLTKETQEASRDFFPAGAKVPSQALTMGIATILDCKSILMLVTGRSKIPAMRDTLEGPIDAACPASALRRHRDCIMLADIDATAGLSNSGERYS